MLETFIEYYRSAIHWGYMLCEVHEMSKKIEVGERKAILVESPYISSTVLGISNTFLHLGLTITLRSGCHYDPYITDMETEIQRGKMTCPKSLKYEEEELVF